MAFFTSPIKSKCAISAISGLSMGLNWSWYGIALFSALLMSINALCSILKRYMVLIVPL